MIVLNTLERCDDMYFKFLIGRGHTTFESKLIYVRINTCGLTCIKYDDKVKRNKVLRHLVTTDLTSDIGLVSAYFGVTSRIYKRQP